jgi:hypothetical protein
VVVVATIRTVEEERTTWRDSDGIPITEDPTKSKHSLCSFGCHYGFGQTAGSCQVLVSRRLSHESVTQGYAGWKFLGFGETEVPSCHLGIGDDGVMSMVQ